MESIRARFKFARKLRGKTQREVAEHFKVDTGTVYRWESGIIELTLPTLEAAAELLQVSRVWLVFGEGSGPKALPTDPPPSALDDEEPHEGAA